MKNLPKSIAIIGAGPAGLAAALQLQRYSISPIIFSHQPNQSLLRNAGKIENYLGMAPGISGEKLLANFYTQATIQHLTIIPEAVTQLDFQSQAQCFQLKTSCINYYFDKVIIASGTKPLLLPQLTKHADLLDKKFFYEIFPLRHKKHKKIIIIGGGDVAFDYALNLHPSNKIIIVCRSSKPKALPLLVQRAYQTNNITIILSNNLQSILLRPNADLSCIFQQNHQNIRSLLADYLVIAIGRKPQKDFYSKTLAKSEASLRKQGLLYLIGDVKNSIYRQTAIAVGDGINAAMKIALDDKNPP